MGRNKVKPMKKTDSAKRFTPGARVTITLTESMAKALKKTHEDTGLSGNQSLFEFLVHRGSGSVVAEPEQGAA